MIATYCSSRLALIQNLRRNSRPGCFAFLILLYNWWNESLIAHAAEVNVTVDDADPSILYVPSGSWHSNLVPCSFCLEPDSSLAYQKTFHDGTHIIPTVDGDDLPSLSSSRAPRSTSTGNAVTSSANSRIPTSTTSRTSSQAPRPTTQTTTQDNDHDDDDDDDDHGNDGPSHTRRQEEEFNPFATSKFDADDPEFVDQPVFVQYNFTGTPFLLAPCWNSLMTSFIEYRYCDIHILPSSGGSRASKYDANNSEPNLHSR